ncbi:hypothetical protein GLA29479_2551 [Lysobacter antibioticus]|nr:hypothetical protein GLA29479_2551 [Lysobacter antibioticus]
MRSGYITLKRHGEAIEENEDSLIPQETPEIVSEGIQVLSEQLSIPIAAVSREMHVQPKLLNDLLGISETNSTTNVVNLFN